MGIVLLDMAMSLDGYIAGPDDASGGLHDWFFAPSGRSAEVIAESIHTTGALVMGRRTYDLGASMDGFIDTPYQVPHVVLSHSIPAKQANGTTQFRFVSTGIVPALDEARAAAGDKAVVIAGGATTAQQYLQARLVDEMQIHLVPVLLGSGIRLFDNLGTAPIALESSRVIGSTGVTHLRYRLVK